MTVPLRRLLRLAARPGRACDAELSTHSPGGGTRRRSPSWSAGTGRSSTASAGGSSARRPRTTPSRPPSSSSPPAIGPPAGPGRSPGGWSGWWEFGGSERVRDEKTGITVLVLVFKRPAGGRRPRARPTRLRRASAGATWCPARRPERVRVVLQPGRRGRVVGPEGRGVQAVTRQGRRGGEGVAGRLPRGQRGDRRRADLELGAGRRPGRDAGRRPADARGGGRVGPRRGGDAHPHPAQAGERPGRGRDPRPGLHRPVEVRLSFDAASNTLSVAGPEATVAEIKELCRKLDADRPGKRE